MKANAAASCVIAVLSSGCIVNLVDLWADFGIGNAGSDTWVRVEHPELPLSFEVQGKKESPIARLSGPSIGYLKPKGAPVRVFQKDLFWGYGRGRSSFNIHPLQYGFSRLTSELERVDEQWLRALEAELERGEEVWKLYRSGVLSEGLDDAEVRWFRTRDVGGRRAAVFCVDQIRAGEERPLRTNFVALVPLDRTETLAVFADVNVARSEELEAVFEHVLDSVRFRGKWAVEALPGRPSIGAPAGSEN